jgi:hypothetical protein
MFQPLQAGADEMFFGLGILFFLFLIAIGITILVLGIIVTMQAYKAGRTGWWIYLIAIFISPLNLVAIILWFAMWKQKPLMVDGKPFL